ncbi:MAG TPA: ATP-binding protein [Ktedonobacteraceae bacterium]|jgi:PAS domain S-box-containing protein|nr:ATP-binding protein [Ktedonobacteraceae bacterium]
MLSFMHRSLLIQLLSVYLLFVLIVLLGGVGVNAVVAQQLSNDAQASDQALAQGLALETGLQLSDATDALKQLGPQVAKAETPAEVITIFQAFKAARRDIDAVYWLDSFGGICVSFPQPIAIGAEFSPPGVVQQALASPKPDPAMEVGLAIEPIANAGVMIAERIYGDLLINCNPRQPHTGTVAGPIHVHSNTLVGIIAISLSLKELSEPLQSVVNAQQKQGRNLRIDIIDGNSEVVATSYPEPSFQVRILQNVSGELPGTNQAMQGHANSQVGMGPDGQDWLFSAVPVPQTGWTVVVQRPVSEALAVVRQFQLWLLITALLFTIGGMLFWLILLVKVIRPLHTLAIQHQVLPTSEESISNDTVILAERDDEVGNLARSLVRLERDGLKKLGELRTLLETSNAVVRSLEPHAVVGKIIREVLRLVDLQAAAILLPDEQGVLRVLESIGHSTHYDATLSISPEDSSSPAVLALREGRPIQKLHSHDTTSLSYEEGYRCVLAIPIISRHAGGVVLLVHRTEPRPFGQNEIDLLLMFANYATLAWEHAVLYERSDERLRQVAQENEQLYQQASKEKQTLAAIMGSMSDGLVLTGIDGIVLYANMGASSIAGLSIDALEGKQIDVLYNALRSKLVDHIESEPALGRVQSGKTVEELFEFRQNERRRVIHLRLFDVADEAGQAIGRGLLLRDITRERELDEFKTTLLAAVGHEVRTPLTAIKGYASTLLQDDVAWSLTDQRHFLQAISSEADRLAQLVSNLLDLSRQEAGLLLLKRTPTSLKELVHRIISEFALSSPDFTISTQIPGALSPVFIDIGRIDVVLQNLIANGLLYGAGRVSISARRQDDMVIVSVSDNGPGIDPDELPHVFERFYRARHGRQQHSNGTGLGLAICKAFVEAHGGSIWAESSIQGTIISFSLPLASPTASEVAGNTAATTL